MFSTFYLSGGISMAIDSWKTIDEDYLNYLRKIEKRIPFTNYGSDKMKPFFGALFETNDLIYVTQVSSPKERHKNLKQSLDFYKYYFKNRLVGVVNLNYMFPVPKKYISNLIYSQIDKFKTFNTEQDKANYIRFLKLQLQEIKKLDLESNAQKLYDLKASKPYHKISQRCFDFKLLESYALSYEKELQTV